MGKLRSGNISDLEKRQIKRFFERLCGLADIDQLRQFSLSQDHPSHSTLSAARERASSLLRVLARLKNAYSDVS